MSAWTVDRLADTLDGLRVGPPSTAGLSALDEAAGQFRDLGPEVQRAHEAFARARWAHKDAYARSEDEGPSWAAAVDAGKALADALRAAEVEVAP